MAPVNDVLADFDAAFEDLLAADSAELRRRSLRSALACLYELRAFREGGPPSPEAGAYYRRAASSTSGQITEGISWLRGLMTHTLTHDVSPESPLYPSERLFPSRYLFPGTNLCWRMASELPTTSFNRQGASFYDTQVAGLPVLPTLHLARGFLDADPGPTM